MFGWYQILSLIISTTWTKFAHKNNELVGKRHKAVDDQNQPFFAFVYVMSQVMLWNWKVIFCLGLENSNRKRPFCPLISLHLGCVQNYVCVIEIKRRSLVKLFPRKNICYRQISKYFNDYNMVNWKGCKTLTIVKKKSAWPYNTLILTKQLFPWN